MPWARIEEGQGHMQNKAGGKDACLPREYTEIWGAKTLEAHESSSCYGFGGQKLSQPRKGFIVQLFIFARHRA